MVVVEWLEEWLLNGTLGRLNIGFRSGAYVELLLEAVSKWPDRFPRRPGGMAKPESVRDVGVSGRGGKVVDVGESFGEGGVLPFAVELVDGR